MGCGEGMGWDGMGWVGMGWVGLGWDGIGVRREFVTIEMCQFHPSYDT